jgi:ubiquitin-like 1-activating enzyme E1 A
MGTRSPTTVWSFVFHESRVLQVEWFHPSLSNNVVKRMRNATILVINLKGLATEVIKNIVLAGIGKLILIDGNVVSEEDLGSGFFFRDEDVGKKVRERKYPLYSVSFSFGSYLLPHQRVDAAKSRIESLNPLVAVETVSSSSLLEDDERLEAVVTKVDLICLTDRSKHEMVSERHHESLMTSYQHAAIFNYVRST